MKQHTVDYPPKINGLLGKSGCKVELISEDGILRVRKTSSEFSYNQRLKAQMNKQLLFDASSISDGSFKIPKVYDFLDGGEYELSSFSMDYIFGRSYREFLEEANLSELNIFLAKLISMIENEINVSRIARLSTIILEEKLESVLKCLSPEIQIKLQTTTDYIHNFFANNAEIEIPTGFCHGDLTLANMMFTKNSIFLIDFLDTYLESPIQDIVKFRQDTRYFWSIFIETKGTFKHSGKLLQVLRFMDTKFHSHFIKYSFYKEYYDIFDKINLLRILPYLNDREEQNFIIEQLQGNRR